MVYQYSRREFESDLTSAESFLHKVLSVGDKIRQQIKSGLSAMGVSAEIVYVGSTSPERLTTIIDPRSPDNRYPCDFDIGVICKEEYISDNEKERILETILPDGTTKKSFGRIERNRYVNKFPVGVAVFGHAEAEGLGPLAYSQQFNLNDNQVRDVRRLRLFMMRNGLYGGFTKGFKGIALEQLALSGDFDTVLSNLFLSEEISVLNPLDGKNLTANLQGDIVRRTKLQSGVYTQRGLIRAMPYTIEGWQEDHPQDFTFGLVSRNEDATFLFNQVNRFVARALGDIGTEKDFSCLVIPHYRFSDVLVAISGLEEKKVIDFQTRFSKRWDSVNGFHN